MWICESPFKSFVSSPILSFYVLTVVRETFFPHIPRLICLLSILTDADITALLHHSHSSPTREQNKKKTASIRRLKHSNFKQAEKGELHAIVKRTGWVLVGKFRAQVLSFSFSRLYSFFLCRDRYFDEFFFLKEETTQQKDKGEASRHFSRRRGCVGMCRKIRRGEQQEEGKGEEKHIVIKQQEHVHWGNEGKYIFPVYIKYRGKCTQST